MSLTLNATTAEEAVPEFNRKFGSLKSKLTNVEKFLEKNDSAKINDQECRSRIINIEKVYEDFNSITNNLIDLISENELEKFNDTFAEFEDRFHSLIGQLSMISENRVNPKEIESKSVGGDSDSSKTFVKPQTIKLPQIKIPTFDGSDLTQWSTFRDTYVAVIHENDALDEVLKFTYLMDKLRGDAKASIGHISLTKLGYEKAWKTLTRIYDDRRVILEKHIEALIDLEPISKRKETELRKLLNNSLSHISSLNASGYEFDSLSQMFALKLVTRKLDGTTRGEWEETIEINEIPTWEKFIEFLERKCRVLRETESSSSKTSTNTHSNSKPSSKSSFNKSGSKRESSFFAKKATTNSNEKCDICGKPHHPYFSCSKFLSLTPLERYEKIKSLNGCINCLHPKHRVSDCKSSGCKICKSRHHTLLHFDQSDKNKPENDEDTQSTSNNSASNPTSNFYSNNDTYHKSTILPTAIVSIEDGTGKLIECRALLDSGSQSNFINEEFVNKLNFVSRNDKNLTVIGLNESKSTITQSISTNVHSNYKRFYVKLDFAITDKISDRIPSNTFDISRWQLPKNIRLADPLFNCAAPIDILIGVEMFPEILLPNRIKLSQNLPNVQESMFGWIVFGKYERRVEHNFSVVENSTDIVKNEQLDQSIKKFWEIENIPTKRFFSEEEKKCEAFFLQTTKRDSNGRYTVSIPFRESPECLGDSKLNALKRFNYLERKLEANDDLKRPYVEFINEYLKLGHMKLAKDSINDESNEPTFYMPHHAVLRPSSSSTKLRVVFDASAKTSSNKSLNQLMLVGPTVQDNLFDIILRFRSRRYAMSSDVSKMYRQVQINDEQTKLQRILWRENVNDPIKIFELTTVTYGTASAPYLATRTLNQLAVDEATNFPIASDVASKDFYVDDLITGCDDINEAKLLQQEMINMLNTGGFHLHKWCANDPRLLKDISAQDLEELKFNEFSLGDCVKALGLLWQPKEDYFVFKPPTFDIDKPLTKRSIVSDVAKLYDPLGFLTPVIITGKIFVQNLWESKIDWDDSIPSNLQDIWINYSTTLNEISHVRINRNVMGHTTTNKIIRTELHGFSDASEKAYGACLYIKTIDSENNVSVNLLCSKSRVAPLKTLSLPRLELSGALLLSKLTSSVMNALDLQFDDIILWSDSTITLCWVKTPPHKLKTFIANRVNEIQELTSNLTWKHIGTANNPADLITRGVMPNDLHNLRLWWNGPELLQSDNYDSIMTNTLSDFDTTVSELKQEQTTMLATETSNIFLDLIPKYEYLEKLIRVAAYVLRFINARKLRETKKTSYLTVSELENSTLQLVKFVQHASFGDEIKALSKNQDISQKSLLKNLHPFLDKNGLIRVGGRLSNSTTLDYNVKHQILLPPKHTLTRLIFRYEHEKNCHAGPQLLLSFVRQRYWPIHGKITAKQTVHSCVTCFRVKPTASEQIMGNLPIERFSSFKAFLHSGVDFCGPFAVKMSNKRNATPQKMYVATFVCLCVKAVHFEIVENLSTESFIACLKRFAFRRGRIDSISSDNATNFRGAKNELHELYELFNSQNEKKKITDFCTSKRIEWKFIPPRAPNFGGLWEASVKSFKTHFKRVTRDRILNYEQFSTLVVQIEGILNSRPLSCMSSDPTDPEPLTPGHFLTGGPILSIPEPSVNDIKENRLSKWQELSKMIESFWRRYSLEYLHNLQTRSKWTKSKTNIKEGDVVLIIQDNLPPIKWPLAVVISTIPGSDGKIRVVELRMVVDGINKIFKRSITKICKLPFEV